MNILYFIRSTDAGHLNFFFHFGTLQTEQEEYSISHEIFLPEHVEAESN